MKSIRLTRGLATLVDDGDFEFLAQWKWCAQRGGRTFYACRRGNKHDGHNLLIYMHRILNSTPSGMVTDHIDGNGLNNVRANLRSATILENTRNKQPQLNGSSSFKGVWLDASSGSRKKWRSGIRINGRMRYLGRFSTEESAAEAYNTEAAKEFGEFHRGHKQ